MKVPDEVCALRNLDLCLSNSRSPTLVAFSNKNFMKSSFTNPGEPMISTWQGSR